jgi:hypothetical protein
MTISYTNLFRFLLIAIVITAFTAFIGGAPLRYFEPIVCVKMLGVICQPFTVYWNLFAADIIAWMAGLLVLFIVLSLQKKPSGGKRKKK